MRLSQLLTAVCCLMVTSSCGSGTPAPSEVHASVTPATATIAVNATLSLQANATGFTATPQVAWWIEKAPGSRNALYCGLDYSASPPPETDCPCGYIAYNSSA